MVGLVDLSNMAWFKLRCLSSILAISWEIQILNFIEIVWYILIKESVSVTLISVSVFLFIVRSIFGPVYFVLFVFFGITIEIVLN